MSQTEGTEKTPGTTGFNSVTGRRIRAGMTSPELFLPIGIMAILVLLLIPLPTWLLDLSLTISITLAVVILMTVVFIQSPLELTSFPTILLISTMLRLGLNVASTRLILSEGHTGTNAAGQVVLPGLINAHQHDWYGLFKGIAGVTPAKYRAAFLQ